MKKGIIKASVLLSACNLLISVIFISFVSPFNVFADISDSNSENRAVEEAVLRTRSLEDLKATEAYLMSSSYNGNNEPVDTDKNGTVNIVDMINLKSEYNQTGDFFDLAGEMFGNTVNDTDSVIASNQNTNTTVINNVVIVLGKTTIDFNEYNYKKLLKSTDNLYFIEFHDLSEAKEAITKLRNNPDVIAADLDGFQNFDNGTETEADDLSITSDYILSNNDYDSWGVKAIEIDKYAKYLSKNTNTNIKIGVLDTGFDTKHPDLKGKFVDGYDYGDMDDNVSHIFSFTQENYGRSSHGTHVSGIIVDCCRYTDVKIVPIKVMNKQFQFTQSAILMGLEHAKSTNCKVINCSFGWSRTWNETGDIEAELSPVEEYMKLLIDSDITIVVSAGNDGVRGLQFPFRYSANTARRFPSRMKECIVVGAMDSKFKVADFSCFGESVDLIAPGVDIYSTVPTNYLDGHDIWDGTSMSAPYISSAVALIKSQFPSYTPAQIEQTLIKSCDDIGTIGFDKYSGYGVPKLSKLITNGIQPSVILSSEKLTMLAGDRSNLTAQVTPSTATINWTSSNNSIASVDSNGNITAKSEGTTVITASISYNNKNYSDTCTVTVSKPNIRLNETSKSVYQTDTFTLSALTTPNNMSVYWSSSNNNVATVANGKVKAINPGTTNITASISYNNQSYSASCKVTVNEVSVKLSETSKTIYQTDVFTINAYTTPSNIPVTWKTSNSNILTVKDGKVTGINPGSAVITASIVYNGQEFSDSCSVTIKKVSIEISPDTNSVFITDSLKLTAKTSPEGLGVSWNSENNMIASVNNGSVTTKAKGNVLIAAKMVYNGVEYSATSRISVLEPSVKLNESQVKINVGDTYKLIATTLPEGAKVTWETDDSSICTVNDTGIITGLKTGNAIVKAKIVYGQKTYYDECNVFVGEPGITLNKTSFSMFIQDSQTLVATIKAIDGAIILSSDNLTETASDIVWKSSDGKIATVSNNGTVTGISVGGPVTITASYDFNGKTYSATCQVTVMDRPTISFKNLPDNIYIGDKYKIPYAVTPSNQSITWTSSDTSVITVDSRGVITAISNGSAILKASFKYNGVNYYTTGNITVLTPTITIDSSKTIIQGDQVKVNASTKPNNQTVSWSSSDSSIVSVDSNGNITGKEAGSTSIIAQFTYMGNIYSARCNVTVNPLTLTLSSYNDSGSQNVWDIESLIDGSVSGYIINLPNVNSTAGSDISWSIISDNAQMVNGGTQILCKQPGTVIARCTATKNRVSVYKDYAYNLTLYKTTTDINYFYKTSNNPYNSYDNRYSFNVPNHTTVYITEIAQNGIFGESGTTIYGKTTYNGCEGWIIITKW